MRLFDEPADEVATIGGSDAIDFFPTPSWFASAIVDRYLPDLDAGDIVLEPTCGDGSFLRAIPDHVRAYGIELDATLAAEARRSSGRMVITGDVLDVALPENPTAVVGNPPFVAAFVERLVARMHCALPEGAPMVLLLSAHLFQTSATVARYADAWSLSVELVPRDVYPRLQRPLVVAKFTKNALHRIIGIAFAQELVDLRGFPASYQALLRHARTNAYVAACTRALETLGRPASIAEVCEQIEGRRPTRTEFWREATRRALAQAFVRVAPGVYDLPGRAA